VRVNAPLPLNVGPVIRVVTYIRIDGQQCLNTYDYTSAAAPAPSLATLAQFSVDWTAANGANLTAVLSSRATWTGNIVSCLSLNTTPSAVDTFAVPLAGAVVQPALPGEMAAILARYTSVRGQHGIGRVMLPAIPITFTAPATDPNILTGAAVTAYNVLAVSLRTVVVSAGVNWVPVLSQRPAPGEALVTRSAGIVSYVTRTLLGTVRRRREGRGI